MQKVGDQPELVHRKAPQSFREPNVVYSIWYIVYGSIWYTYIYILYTYTVLKEGICSKSYGGSTYDLGYIP